MKKIMDNQMKGVQHVLLAFIEIDLLKADSRGLQISPIF